MLLESTNMDVEKRPLKYSWSQDSEVRKNNSRGIHAGEEWQIGMTEASVARSPENATGF